MVGGVRFGGHPFQIYTPCSGARGVVLFGAMEPWYVLRVRSNGQSAVLRAADRFELRVLWPEEIRVVKHHRSKRLIEKHFDLFPGYCFVQGRTDRILDLRRQTPQVFTVLSVEGEPAPVNSWVMEELLVMIEAGAFDYRKAYAHDLSLGDEVKIEVAGVELKARVIEMRDRSDVMLEVDMPIGKTHAIRRGMDLSRLKAA